MPEMENNESISSNNASTFNFPRQLEPANIISEEARVKSEQNSNEKNADILLNDEFFVDLLMRNSVSVLPELIDDSPTDKNPHNSDQPNLSIERNDSDNLFSDKEQNQNLMKSPESDSDEKFTPVLIDITGEVQNEDFDNSIAECTISATPFKGIRKSDTNSVQYPETDSCLKSSNESSKKICEIEIMEVVAEDSQSISINKQDFDNSTTESTISAIPTNGIRKPDTNSIQYTGTHSCLKFCNESSEKMCEIEIIEAISEDSQSISINKEDVDNSTRECTISAIPTNGLGKSDTNCIQYTETDSCLKSSNESSEKICEIEIIEAVAKDSQSISIINNKQHTLIENFSKDEYRCESDVWTDDEDSSSSDSSSSDSETFFQAMQDNFDRSKPKKITPVKTKGELGLDDLPPIEDLTISVEENEMTLIGKVHAIVETLVVIRSFKDMKALDLDSVLFLFHDRPLGRVFDVFGPVNEPFYSIRFNTVDQINEKGVQVGAEVYFAPEKMDITLYVFVEDLQKQKGSDASWKDNNEPPVEFLDYSDDEEERRSKRERMMKNRNEQFSKDCDAPTKRALLSDNSSSTTYIPPPKPATSYQNNARQFTQRFSTPNPFLSRMPPPSPSLSVCSVMSPVRVQHSFYSPPSQPRPPALVHPQNILCRPPPSIFRSPYQQQPPMFGQVAVLNPLPSPSYPTLIPASPFTPPPTQNCFRHEFARSPSPGFQVQRLPSDLQSPNRSFSSPNVHPSHPLTVEIPSVNDSSFPGHPVQNRNPQQQFMSHQSANVNSFQVPNVNNASFAMHQYPQIRSPMQQFSSFPVPNFNNTFMPNVNFPPGNGQPRFYR